MTRSRNVLFVGESPPDDEHGHPLGVGIARLIKRSLRDHGFNPNPIDNWRDCGWSFDFSINDAQFEISLASTAETNLWMLQITCTNEPGVIARLCGKRSVDHSDDIHEIASTVHETLQSNGYTDLRWCLDGYPDDGESTPEPVHPHGKAT
ncbi:MAG: hypothetical protein GXP24_01310 [Planctomycetes bacterium]|nr:hypothetical protein [Planctomycetota bacterium]